MRLAVLTSHPVQYYAPLFRELAERVDLHVFYAHNATAEQQAAAVFGKAFNWDVDLTSGYAHSFLHNVATRPGTDSFGACDTPEIADRLWSGGFGAVLALGWHLKSMLQGIFAAKRLGIPVMVRGDSQLGTPRGAVKTAVKRVTYPALLRVFDAALYAGQRNFDYFRHFGYPAARLFHSPHCVDTERFAASATPQAPSWWERCSMYKIYYSRDLSKQRQLRGVSAHSLMDLAQQNPTEALPNPHDNLRPPVEVPLSFGVE